MSSPSIEDRFKKIPNYLQQLSQMDITLEDKISIHQQAQQELSVLIENLSTWKQQFEQEMSSDVTTVTEEDSTQPLRSPDSSLNLPLSKERLESLVEEMNRETSLDRLHSQWKEGTKVCQQINSYLTKQQEPLINYLDSSQKGKPTTKSTTK